MSLLCTQLKETIKNILNTCPFIEEIQKRIMLLFGKLDQLINNIHETLEN